MSVHDIVTECAKYSLLECQENSNRESDTVCSSLVHSTTVRWIYSQKNSIR